jgi:D-glycero-alpha-D-manno-heptose-7-phosphate kinase
MVRAPFRVSFAGGGSDLQDFYSKNGYGSVLSATIDKYMYIMIHPYFHDKIRIKYSKLEDVNDIDKIQHPLVRECLRAVGIEKGIEIASIADVPAGTGVGSSSTFTICLLHALYAYKKCNVTKEQLAKEACRIEIDVLDEPIGKQDQYAASYGDFNYIRFNKDETVFMEHKVLKPERKLQLERNLLMFYVAKERRASVILSEQKNNMKKNEKFEIVRKMVELTEKIKKSLNEGDINIFGRILHEGWLLKKELTDSISNPMFDRYYERALKAGALGGKLLGAGGGGFFLFYCEQKYHSDLRRALGLRELEFKFESEGTKILFTGQ